jgi:hypothetical protein
MTSVISSVVVNAQGVATVAWSVGKNKAPRDKNSVFPLPDALKVPGSLIAAEVVFDYKPVVGYAFTGNITMSETAFAQPRLAPATTGVACTAPGC